MSPGRRCCLGKEEKEKEWNEAIEFSKDLLQKKQHLRFVGGVDEADQVADQLGKVPEDHVEGEEAKDAC